MRLYERPCDYGVAVKNVPANSVRVEYLRVWFIRIHCRRLSGHQCNCLPFTPEFDEDSYIINVYSDSVGSVEYVHNQITPCIKYKYIINIVVHTRIHNNNICKVNRYLNNSIRETLIYIYIINIIKATKK